MQGFWIGMARLGGGWFHSEWWRYWDCGAQRANEGIYNGGDTPEQDARVAIAWLKAYGAGAIAVSGPHSQEIWKGFGHPKKFDGRLGSLTCQESG